MYKKFFMGIAAMAALTLVSCSSDDLNSLSDNSSKNEAISFDGYLGRSAVAVNGSRGSMLDKPALQNSTEGFGVFGNYNKDATTTYGENLFMNQKVTYSEPNWTYFPYRYWLPEGHIDFLAYAPYDKKITSLTDHISKMDFTVSSKIAEQKDLLWANAAGQTQTNNPVTFTFNHALSRIGYTVKLKKECYNNVTIILKSVTLAGSEDGVMGAFYETGTIDLSTATNMPTENANLWSNKAGQQKFDWFSGEYKVHSSTAFHPDGTIEKDKDYLFVIPQDFSETATDKLYVIVTYTIKYNGISEVFTNTVHKQIKQNFEQGRAYTINLTIGSPIDFNVDVVNVWDPAEGSSIDINSWE